MCKKRWQGCLECVLCLVVVLCRASCVRVASPVLRCLQFLLLLHSRPFFRALTCVSRLLSSTPHPLSPALYRAYIHPLLHPVPAVNVDADQLKGEGPGEPWNSPTQKPVDRSPLSRILLGRIKHHVELLLAHICHCWYVGKEIPSNHHDRTVSLSFMHTCSMTCDKCRNQIHAPPHSLTHITFDTFITSHSHPYITNTQLQTPTHDTTTYTNTHNDHTHTNTHNARATHESSTHPAPPPSIP